MNIKTYKTGYGSGETTVEAIEFTNKSKDRCSHFVKGHKMCSIEDAKPIMMWENGHLTQKVEIGDYIVYDPSHPIDFQFTAWKPKDFVGKFQFVTEGGMVLAGGGSQW